MKESLTSTQICGEAGGLGRVDQHPEPVRERRTEARRLLVFRGLLRISQALQ